MTVNKRMTSRGETKEYHYAFMCQGKRYYGVCEGCTTQRAAEMYEAKIRATAIKAAEQKTVKAIVEVFRDELTGGRAVKLDGAFELSLEKPHSRRSSDRTKEQKRAAFADFVAFMAANYPEVQKLTEVQKKHAEAYFAWIREHGRFQEDVTYQRAGKTITRKAAATPAARTVNLYLTTAKEVFRLLAHDAGLTENPFDLPKAAKDEAAREAFTPEELRLIWDNLDDFTRPLFTLAIYTALREGDICTLRWQDVNFSEMLIKRVMNKTGHKVEIPIGQELLQYLKALPQNGEYIFPDLAKMYRDNPTGISTRIKKFLEQIGIKGTTRIPQGRSRAVSVKDLHSCRHSFCYYAGMNNIPLAVVQSIVGHMTPEMTKHYMAHATLEDKRRGIQTLEHAMIKHAITEPEPLAIASDAASDDSARVRLLAMVQSMTEEEAQAVLKHIENKRRKRS